MKHTYEYQQYLKIKHLYNVVWYNDCGELNDYQDGGPLCATREEAEAWAKKYLEPDEYATHRIATVEEDYGFLYQKEAAE